MATLIAWDLAAEKAKAQGGQEKPKEGASGDEDLFLEASGLIYKRTKQVSRQAKGPKQNGIDSASWFNQGAADEVNTTTAPSASHTNNVNYSSGTYPEDAVQPDTPNGYVPVGWVTTPADAIKNAYAIAPPEPVGWWDPDEDGENSNNTDGSGILQPGWYWTSQIRTRIEYKSFRWARSFKFKKKK